MLNQTVKTAAVVGGGISGLNAARRLALGGYAVTLFERRPRLGGMIKGVWLGGQLVDIGAEAFAVARPQTLDLIQQLGLNEKLVNPARTDSRILTQQGFIPIPHGVLGIPSNLDDPAVLDAIGEEAVAAAKRLDAHPWQLEQPGTVAELVETRLGFAVLENLVAPVLAGVHASDPALLEIDAVAPGLFARAKQLGSLTQAAASLRANAARPGAAVASLDGGMHTLVSALAQSVEDLGATIELNTQVESIQFADGKYQVHATSGIHTADVLVMATPPAVTAQLLKRFPDLSAALGGIAAVNVAVVALVVEDAGLDTPPLGPGVLAAPNLEGNLTAKAATHTTAKWKWLANAFGPGKHLVRLSYGRNGVLPPVDDSLIQIAIKDAGILFGIRPESVTESLIQVWNRSLIQAKSGHLANLQHLSEAQKRHPGLLLVGAGLGGNGITGILAKSFEQLEKLGL